MKKFLNIVGLIALSVIVFSCKKDDSFNYPEGTVGISKITNYPTFTMTGDAYASVVKGGTFTDPGVSAKEGTTDLEVKVSGQVNTAVVGIYNIVYSATNKDGFAGSVSRTVAVLPAAETAGVDVSGKYSNVGSFNYTATWTKLAPGFYRADNIWGGSSAAVIASYILCVDGTNLILPVNSLSAYGRVQGTGTLSAGTAALKVDLLDQGATGSAKNWKKL
jgi:hypothetical protein